jgi:hypothetical protein
MNEGDAEQGTPFARRQPGIGGGRIRQRLFCRQGDQGVERRIQPLDPPQEVLGELRAGNLPLAKAVGEFADRKVMQHPSRIAFNLLDHPRHHVQAGGHGRRVALVFLVVVGLRNRVGSQTLVLAIERMRHGQYALGVRARQLIDEVDDARQAAHIHRHLLRRDGQPRKVRDFFDVLTG